MGEIYEAAHEFLKKEDSGYLTQIPILLSEIRKYYREYITIDLRVGLLEQDNEKIKNELEDIKKEVDKLKKKKIPVTRASLIDFWDNEYDERWNDC